MQTATTITMNAGTNSKELSQQWASRPADERFLDLVSLHDAVERRTTTAATETIRGGLILPMTEGEAGLVLRTPDHESVAMTHWSFGQLANAARAPANYLRSIPPRLAAANLIWGLRNREGHKDGELMYYDADPEQPMPTLRAMTSEKYGRIYDLDIVRAVQRLNEAHEGRWVVPASSYTSSDPKQATTLYASDRDVYLFLCDPSNPIQIPGQEAPSHRGFIVSNSEVGAGVFSLITFLYERVCDNRIIWGQSERRELRIRHTTGAPERFLREATPQLLAYANATEGAEVARIERAQSLRLASARAAGTDDQDDILRWVQQRTGLSKGIVGQARQRALEEEGQFDTAWDAVQGITAYARGIAHTDARVEVERAAGKLLG